MKRLLMAILAASVLTGSAAAETGLAGWRYQAPVETGGKTGYLNAAVAPDSPLWEKGNIELTDLRVVDDKGQTIPYLLWRPRSTRAEATVPGRLINVGRDEEKKQSTATLDLGESPLAVDRVRVSLGLQGRYLLAAQVTGSHDQKEWVQLPISDLLYDMSAQGGERNDLIRFSSPVQMRYIRLDVPDFDGRPAIVRELAVSAAPTTVLPQAPAFAGKPAVSHDPVRKLSIMTVDMSSRRRADEVELTTSSHSFFRGVTAEGSSDHQNWQRLGSAMLYSYEAGGQRRLRTALPLSGCQCRYLRLLVEDGDDAPLADPEIRILAVPARVFFEAQPGRSYTLYVGNPGAGRPDYDLARIPVNPEAGAPVSLGALSENPGYSPVPPPFTERFPWVLPAVLGVLVLIMGAGIVQMARRIRARETESESEPSRTDPD